MPSFLSSDALAPLRNLRHQVYANPSKKRASVTVSPKSMAPAAPSSSAPAGVSSHPQAGPSSQAGPSVQTVVGGGGVSKRSSPTKTSTTRWTPSVLGEVKRRRDEQAQSKLGVGSVGLAGPQECRMLFEDEYREDVICYMREQETATRSQVDLMDMQPELQWYMRPYLVEFLVEIHQQFRLRPEVLYLSLNIVDRYVSKRVVFKKHYQLVGCAALWIAAKYEDSKDKVPTVEMLRDMCCAAYDESAFLQMEGHVLSTIGWNLSHPTAESWLRLSCMGTSKEDAETQHVARFVMELTLFHKEFVAFLPSAIAGGALLLARHLLNKPRRQLDEYDTAVDVAFRIDAHLGQQLELVSEIVVAKYSHGYYNRASHFVRQEYLKGRRFEIRVPAPLTLAMPKRASRSVSGVPSLVPSWPSRSNSSTSVASDFSSPRRSGSAYSSDSEMPDTPCTPAFGATPDPFLAMSASNSASSLSSMRGVPTVCEPVKPSAVVVKFPLVAEKENAHNGYVVQEPRTVFSSLNAKASVNNAVMRPAQSYATLPVPVAMSRRFSQ